MAVVCLAKNRYRLFAGLETKTGYLDFLKVLSDFFLNTPV